MEVAKANGRHDVPVVDSVVGINGHKSSVKLDLANAKSQQETSAKAAAGTNNSIKEDLTPVVICGPSGVGKGTLISKLMAEFPNQFGFSVSHTTRKPRNSEQDGVHYHFIERAEMEAQVSDGKFLEYADVHGNLYGTSIAAVEDVADTGKRCILDIDVQGAQQVKRSPLDALFIFIGPPSFEELEARLRGRGTETEEQVQKRLKNAKAEMARSTDTTLFDHVLINDQIDDAYKKFKNLLGIDAT